MKKEARYWTRRRKEIQEKAGEKKSIERWDNWFTPKKKKQSKIGRLPLIGERMKERTRIGGRALRFPPWTGRRGKGAFNGHWAPRPGKRRYGGREDNGTNCNGKPLNREENYSSKEKKVAGATNGRTGKSEKGGFTR